MEIWPFWAIVEHGLLTGKLPVSRIYFEEPEAHLHPGAQRSLMEILAFLVRHGVQVVITTHSPYILYAVNNFLMAQQVLNSGHKLPPETPVETALHAGQVTAYRFAPDGNVFSIMDTEVGLIDAHELEQVAEDLGATFTEMQERLEGWV
jgi:energy-coupling factor transporter ATP-binding protein EcfA2